MTRKAGIVGWPVAHSLSPVLHGYWLEKYGIDGAFERVPAEPSQFEAVIADLRAQGFSGVNVTVPHKEAAFALADKVDAAAKTAGAANLSDLLDESDDRRPQHRQLRLGGDLCARLSAPWREKMRCCWARAGPRAARCWRWKRWARRPSIFSTATRRGRRILRRRWRRTSMRGWCPARCRTGTRSRPTPHWRSTAPARGWAASPPLDLDLSALPGDAAVCDIVYVPLQTKLLKDAAARGLKDRGWAGHADASGGAVLRSLFRQAARGGCGSARQAGK